MKSKDDMKHPANTRGHKYPEEYRQKPLFPISKKEVMKRMFEAPQAPEIPKHNIPPEGSLFYQDLKGTNAVSDCGTAKCSKNAVEKQ